MAENIGNTTVLFMGLSVVLTAVLLACVGPIVGVMSTPAEAVAGGPAVSHRLLSGHSLYYCL